ncbi:response regulator [Noviherbaspirillum sp. CPCC 100848]|uniref:histidine kinase n=1 Tax=Noviherbaspirillum album TaxID=3080276 RepID=A0ABU6J7L0_9BURK|nr:response regulator [Noviherbaspirillum sp. CPCC 100848]MEC4719630.1 response regulator [Noviherbaspirillum sp. CPCC 100848]
MQTDDRNSPPTAEAGDLTTVAMGSLLADMNHDIRTSMNGIVGMLELLLETDLTDAQHEYARVAQNSVDTLLEVIERIVDLSLLESNQFSLTRTPFDLLSVLQAACEDKRPAAAEKGLRLTVHYPQSALLVGDPARLRQVVGILVNTAIRVADHGDIAVRHELDLGDRAGKLRMAVHASGPSEAGAQLTAALNQPLRTCMAALKMHGKNAVELALCVRLARLMGGSISVESAPRLGASFRLLLDIPHAAGAIAGMRILLLDEHAGRWDATLAPLAEAGARIEHAGSFAAGMQALSQAAAQGAPYALLLLAPAVQGIDADTLRTAVHGEPGYARLGIGVLMNADAPEKDRIRASGFGAVITEETTAEQLMHAALRLAGLITEHGGALQASTGTPPMDSASAATMFEGQRVLVADDNPVNQQVAIRMLEKIGCRTDVARNGQEAVDMQRDGAYDLILMDCDMPLLDGYQATSLIRRLDGPVKHVPVIALTACTTQDERDRCAAAGMNDFLSKPIRPQTLKDMLTRWMPRAEVAETHSAAVDDELDMVREMFGTDFAELAALYRNDSPPRIAAMRAAHAAGDHALLAKVSHALSGSSASIGATALSLLCRELENAAKAGALGDFAARLGGIEAEYRRVSAKIQSLLG